MYQAKAFEAGAEEDNEEANELDDDELNELLARGGDELGIFTRMDEERVANRLSQWRAEGHKGPLQPPLMQETELPPFYRRDIGDELAAQAQLAEDSLEGRGRRAKNDVRYTDGLTDDQWLLAMEDSGDDVEEAADRKRKRAVKKAERKRMNEMLAEAEAEGKPLSTIKISLDAVENATTGSVAAANSPPATKTKKRARPSISATPSVLGEDGPTVSAKTGAEANRISADMV